MKRAGPGWLLLALAGLAAVIGAFLPFYTYADGIDVTVWSRGLFPTATLIPLLAVVVGVEAVFALLRGHEPRSPFLNFTWEQVRLAVGAFMILLALSYLLQDRAGGTLGIGYVLLAASALATFAGGVLTRRAQLARAPGEEAPEHRPVFKPALASVSRASSDLVKNVADRSHNVRVRLAERREARSAARKEAAEKSAAQRAEMQAAAAKAAAERAEAQKKAAEKAEAANAAAEKAAAAANAAAAAKAAAEQVAEEPAQPAPSVAEEPAHPAPPSATVETLPTEPHPPAATLDELPAEEVPEQPPPPAVTVEAPEATDPLEETLPGAEETKETEKADETEETAELPVVDAAEVDDEKTVEQPRAAKLSAVPSGTEPDATPAPDGDSADRAEEEQKEEEEEPDPPEEKERERADTGTEGPPGG